MSALRIEQVTPLDPRLIGLIEAEGLPVSDLGTGNQVFIMASENFTALAAGGLALMPPHGLLRSLAVAPERRRQGLGSRMVETLIGEARANRVATLYLLTEGAARFFARHGFAETAREEVPDEIAGSAQFTRLCPESATAMVRAL